MIESESELMSIGIALDIQLVVYVLQANYVTKHSLVGLAELQNGKGIYREPMIASEG